MRTKQLKTSEDPTDKNQNKFRHRFQSENQAHEDRKTAYPKLATVRGYLDVRTSPKKTWRRRYFVLSNNFLLCGATEHSEELEKVLYLFFFLSFFKKLHFFFLEKKRKNRFLKTLGTSESQNSKVVAAKHHVNGTDCAIKIVDKRSCDQKSLRSEIQIMKQLDHKSIIRLLDLFENKKYLYIVMEKLRQRKKTKLLRKWNGNRCEGGELFDQIANLEGDHYTEEDCCHVMYQICSGVKYMHSRGIVHRDLKPENILCVRKNSIKTIKIADFGISKMVKGNEPMKTMVGTLSYTAPEILEGKKYDFRVDYWAIGVIMFILLCGCPPFYGESDAEVLRIFFVHCTVYVSFIQHCIRFGEANFDEEDWQHVSPYTVDLVKGLLQKNPSKRKTVDDVLQIAWKVSSTKTAFRMAHKKFKETVLKRKLHRQSMDVFEKSSDTMNRIYKNKTKKDTKWTDKDTLNFESFAHKRGPKTAEYFELQLHPQSRGSFDDNVEETQGKKH
ncbi:hypothetical protein RFI_00227 [Reticulomyxa filosa]|uniref:Protein kinase domain-containing protein n=1 Tax=Reticulomyxa filosa TaxID=46433 RepID=X6PFF1_RETFI|nr:hypothetical protein RFI_00227 [Reticulomyxa filosa]|eukprot:ETO36833.1 hypothetical protein RFI_00227 [Reticulomyxa filosa]